LAINATENNGTTSRLITKYLRNVKPKLQTFYGRSHRHVLKTSEILPRNSHKVGHHANLKIAAEMRTES